MTEILLMTTEGPDAPEVELGGPEDGALIAGEYATKTWNHWTGEDDRLYCGIWECSPGTVTIDYAEWEFCRFLAGKAILTNEAGRSWTVQAGDAFIIPPGFKGTWQTVETVRKHYVILTPKG